jgi:hypothetical protein
MIEIDKEKMFKNVKYYRGKLTIEGHMPLRKYCRDPKIFITTEMVAEAFKDTYDIEYVIQECMMSNWEKKGHVRDGQWIFKAKKKKIPKPPKPKPIENKKNEENAGKSMPFRGRLKKIAKDKIGL